MPNVFLRVLVTFLFFKVTRGVSSCSGSGCLVHADEPVDEERNHGAGSLMQLLSVRQPPSLFERVDDDKHYFSEEDDDNFSEDNEDNFTKDAEIEEDEDDFPSPEHLGTFLDVTEEDEHNFTKDAERGPFSFFRNGAAQFYPDGAASGWKSAIYNRKDGLPKGSVDARAPGYMTYLGRQCGEELQADRKRRNAIDAVKACSKLEACKCVTCTGCNADPNSWNEVTSCTARGQSDIRPDVFGAQMSFLKLKYTDARKPLEKNEKTILRREYPLAAETSFIGYVRYDFHTLNGFAEVPEVYRSPADSKAKCDKMNGTYEAPYTGRPNKENYCSGFVCDRGTTRCTTRREQELSPTNIGDVAFRKKSWKPERLQYGDVPGYTNHPGRFLGDFVTGWRGPPGEAGRKCTSMGGCTGFTCREAIWSKAYKDRLHSCQLRKASHLQMIPGLEYGMTYTKNQLNITDNFKEAGLQTCAGLKTASPTTPLGPLWNVVSGSSNKACWLGDTEKFDTRGDCQRRARNQQKPCYQYESGRGKCGLCNTCASKDSKTGIDWKIYKK